MLLAQLEHEVELAVRLDLVVHPRWTQVHRVTLLLHRRVDLHHEPAAERDTVPLRRLRRGGHKCTSSCGLRQHRRHCRAPHGQRHRRQHEQRGCRHLLPRGNRAQPVEALTVALVGVGRLVRLVAYHIESARRSLTREREDSAQLAGLEQALYDRTALTTPRRRTTTSLRPTRPTGGAWQSSHARSAAVARRRPTHSRAESGSRAISRRISRRTSRPPYLPPCLPPPLPLRASTCPSSQEGWAAP